MTLLSTPLKVLQRRGFDTSRILNSRKAERRRQLEQQRDAGLQAELSKPNKPSESDVDNWVQKLCQEFPEANRELVKRLLQAQSEDHFNNVYAQLVKGYRKKANENQPTRNPSLLQNTSSPESHGLVSKSPSVPEESSRASSGLFSGFRKRMLGSGPAQQRETQTSKVRSSVTQPSPTVADQSQMSRPTSATVGSSSQPGELATPYSDIESNVQHAIRSSRADASNAIQSQGESKIVKESESGFCDSRPVSQLLFLESSF